MTLIDGYLTESSEDAPVLKYSIGTVVRKLPTDSQ